MKVSDILRVKGGTLFTVAPDEPLSSALNVMSQHDIGSLVVMEARRAGRHAHLPRGDPGGRQQRRRARHDRGCAASWTTHPLTCTPETELDEVRRMMLGRHARYMPVLSEKTLMGVISFYDVAKAVVDSQDFENRMLKAYIRDWPVESRDELPSSQKHN